MKYVDFNFVIIAKSKSIAEKHRTRNKLNKLNHKNSSINSNLSITLKRSNKSNKLPLKRKLKQKSREHSKRSKNSKNKDTSVIVSIKTSSKDQKYVDLPDLYRKNLYRQKLEI